MSGISCYKSQGNFGCSTLIPALVSPSDGYSLKREAIHLSGPSKMLQEMIAQYKELLVGKTGNMAFYCLDH